MNNYRTRGVAYCTTECGLAARQAKCKARGFPKEAHAVRHPQMRTDNPMKNPAVRSKVSRTMKAMGYAPTVRGGNGHGMTVPERLMSEATGLTPHTVTTHRRPEGYPTHYKLDLADPAVKLAIEIDGGSHKSLKVRAADARKEEFLNGLGWTVLRFSNSEVTADAIRCAETVAFTTSKLRANTPT